MVKRKTITVVIIAALVALFVPGTLAYFTDEERADNIITSGNIDIELNEWSGEVDDEGNRLHFEDVTGVMPGTEVTKIVEVKNIGANPAYVRISVGKEIVLMHEDGVVDLNLVKLNFNQKAWSYKDGFYYYNYPLKPGDVTVPLFTKVTFSESMGNLYQNSVAKIVVNAYATQVANNGTSALEAEGWPQI